MLCSDTNELGSLIGATVCGQTLRACDDDSAYAVFRMRNVTCGVTVEKGTQRPYLRLTPALQIPRKGRRNFERFLFECDDDALLDLRFDERDGEITLRRDLRNLRPETIEAELAPLLAWIDKDVYPQVMGYVAGLYVGKGKKED